MEPLEARLMLAASPVITEFMASNKETLADQDGDFSDWIEIQNIGDAPADLAGWRLTDNPLLPTKWTFPNTVLAAGARLVVFASGKDRGVAGGQLHANFQLEASGEYLALVRPDLSLASVFAPAFPEQATDVSYGVSQTVTESTLIDAGSAARFFVPSGPELGLDWTGSAGTEPFDDAAWLAAAAGVGFDDAGAGLTGAGLSVPNLIAYWNFEDASNPAVAFDASPGGLYDGVVNGGVYVNFPAPAGGARSMDFDGADTIIVSGLPRPDDAWTYSLWINPGLTLSSATPRMDIFYGRRELGEASPRPHLSFKKSANGEIGLFVRSNGADNDSVLTATTTWAADTWHHLAFTYDGDNHRVFVDGMLESTIPDAGPNEADTGLNIGSSGSGSFYNGLLDEIAIFDGPLSFELTGAQVTGGDIHRLYTQGVGSVGEILYADHFVTDMGASMRGVNASAYLRVPFEVADPQAFDTLRLDMKYDDGFIAWLNGVEVARSNAPLAQAFDSQAAADRSRDLAATFEAFNLTPHLSALRAGTNVLAIQALNESAADGDFLMVPRLVASDIVQGQPRYFTVPTPGAANNQGLAGLVADTTFSVDRGFFDAPFQVEIASATPGASIRYTTNGSTPSTTNGTLYSGPINITTTTTLRAIAYKTDHRPTDVDTQTYIFMASVIQQPNNPAGFPTSWGGGAPAVDYEMDPQITQSPLYSSLIDDALLALPTISIVTDISNLWGTTGIYSNPTSEGVAWERPTSVELIYPDGTIGFQYNAGLRIQGGASRTPANSPKHSLRLLFKDEYGPTKLDFPLFSDSDVTKFDTIVLRAGYNNSWHHWDPVQRSQAEYVRDEFARKTQLEMGWPTPHGQYVQLYINGLYWGLYDATERVNADFTSSYFGGTKEEWDVLNSGEVVDGTRDAWNQMMAIANAGVSSSSQYAAIRQYLDVENFADYIILNHFLGNQDWDDHNWYAARRRLPGEGFKFFAWDSERTLEGVTDNRISVNLADKPTRLFQQLRANAEFRLLFADRIQKLLTNGGVLTAQRNAARFQSIADSIQTAVIGESARWGDYRRDVHVRGAADLYTLNNHWLPEVARIVGQYFPQRTARMLSDYAAAGLTSTVATPALNPNGGQIAYGGSVAITGAGQIYYTLNGQDPRTPASAESFTLVTEAAAKRVLVPSVANGGSTLGLSWTGLAASEPFNDSAWIAGAGGVGYDTEPTYDPYIAIDIQGPMLNISTSAYLRIPFDVAGGQLAGLNTMTLKMRYDDGFVAYLNGVRIAEANALASPLWNSQASASHADADSVQLLSFDVSAHLGALVTGRNVLAIHGLNRGSTSTDFLISPELSAGRVIAAGISPAAQLYGGPIGLTDSGLITARAVNGGVWSALMQAPFQVGAPALAITELYYNPAPLNAAEQMAGFTDADQFEFMELMNLGALPVSLAGLSFQNGVTFDLASASQPSLAPGERVLLVRNAAAFELRFGAGLPVIGTYEGQLANEGEGLALGDLLGRLAFAFSYNDRAPWPTEADGMRASLDLIDVYAVPVFPEDPSTHLGDAANWRAAAPSPGGVPADFNGDLVRNVADIDALFAALAGSSGRPQHDLNLDGDIDPADLAALVIQWLGTRFGDTDLSGTVSIGDLTTLAENFGTSVTSWSQGDFNGDGLVSIGDLTLLAENFGFGLELTGEELTCSADETPAAALYPAGLPIPHDDDEQDDESEELIDLLAALGEELR